MAVICLCSASGSPGVTTTSVGLSLLWPRPVLLVEADPSGASGILAGYIRGTVGYEAGLVDLALSPLDLGDALREVIRPIPGSQVQFVSGARTPAQAGALLGVWQPLGTVLAELDANGVDVIVDAGRLGLTGSPEPLLAAADLTLLVTRTTLPALAAARYWSERASSPGTGWAEPGILLIGERQPYNDAEVAKVLGLPVIGSIKDDADAAATYHRGTPPRAKFETSAYIRSLTAAAEAMQYRITANRVDLMAEVER